MLCGRRCETDKTVRDFGREREERRKMSTLPSMHFSVSIFMNSSLKY